MTEEEVHEFIHESVHQLIELNEQFRREFGIGDYERWDYDLEKATLTFSNNGVPGVIADVLAAGSIATASKSWLWSWNNASLPDHVTNSVLAVPEFGKKHHILS